MRAAPQPQEDFAGTSVAGLVMAIMAVTASVASAMSCCKQCYSFSLQYPGYKDRLQRDPAPAWQRSSPALQPPPPASAPAMLPSAASHHRSISGLRLRGNSMEEARLRGSIWKADKEEGCFFVAVSKASPARCGERPSQVLSVLLGVSKAGLAGDLPSLSLSASPACTGCGVLQASHPRTPPASFGPTLSGARDVKEFVGLAYPAWVPCTARAV